MIKKIISLLLSCWSMGIGLRLLQFPFNDFDKIFDFSILFILGLTNIIFLMIEQYKILDEKNENNNNNISNVDVI